MASDLNEKDKKFVREMVNAGLSWEEIVPRLAAYAIDEYDMQANDCAMCKQVFYANLIKEARKYY